MESSLHIVSPPTLRAQVSARLREAIASGRFRPGDRLIERELCELMSVSRTSIREALRELESERLVTILPNRGPVVSTIDIEQARSIYQVRSVLEGLACRLFARRATDKQLEQLEAHILDLAKAYAKRDLVKALEAKRKFYDLLLEAAANEIAGWMLKNMHIRVSQLRLLSLSNRNRDQESLTEYRLIVAALKRRDEEGAWAACVRHVDNAAAAMLASLDPEEQAQASRA